MKKESKSKKLLVSAIKKEFGEMPKRKVFKKEALAFVLVMLVALSIIIYFYNQSKKDKTELLINAVENNVNKIDNEFISEHKKDLGDEEYVKLLLNHLVRKDQYVRQELVKDLMSVTNGDIVAAGYNKEKILNYIEQVDRKNVKDLEEILAKYTWPKIGQFGTKADVDAWIIVQHADFDPLLQFKSLFFIEQFASVGESNKQNYALLYDKIASKYAGNGLKQKFGTQGKVVNGKFELNEYLGSEYELDQRREQVGFPPIRYFIEGVNKKLQKDSEQ